MRRILIEGARRKKQPRRGGDRRRIPLEDADAVAPMRYDDVLAIDWALGCLEESDPLAASLVKLRFFAGLPMPEAAKALAIPLRTAERNWAYARAWLHRKLSRGNAEPSG
jgi:RNA polymerase sigma factor (TIGR02999 family)